MMKTNEEILNTKFKICDYVEYEVNKNKIVTVLERQDYKIQRFFRKLKIKIPMYKKVEFDEYCSAVFMQLDGNRTVKEVGENLQHKFGDKVNPLYERLLVFLNHIYDNCKYIEKIN